MFQIGNGGTFLPYERLTSISFEERNGMRTFVVREKTKDGKEKERTTVAFPKIADADVMKFLADLGHGHLYRGESDKYLPSENAVISK